jgi:hypothetical protein
MLCSLLVGASGLEPTARVQAGPHLAAQQCRDFQETGQSVCGRFLEYWDQHGGLPQQGLPISKQLRIKSEIDGRTYVVQYFERAIFELHPENMPPYDVLLSLLGTLHYQTRYSRDSAPGQRASTDRPLVFAETGKTLGGRFREYWEANGGLAQNGYPISNEFEEENALDKQVYTVQYFERAVYEFHPENQPPYDVLLTHLGRRDYNRRLPKDCRGIYLAQGNIIAEGKNTVPTSQRYRLKSYYIEEIDLPTPLTCGNALVPTDDRLGIIPERRTISRYWKLVLIADPSGEPLPVGSMEPFMGLDEGVIGSAWSEFWPTRGHGPTKALLFYAYVFDWSLFRDGATPWIGYGGREAALPEPLELDGVR